MDENLSEYECHLSDEILNDESEYVDRKYLRLIGPKCFSLVPEPQESSLINNCHLKNINAPYNLKKFNEPRDPPIIVGKLKYPHIFENLDISVVDALVKVPGDDVYHLPVELADVQEALQMAINYFHANNPDATKDYYCYLRPSSCVVPPMACQRYKAMHADGLLGARHRDNQGQWTKKLSYNFIIFNSMPTEFFVQSLDVSHLDIAKHDFCKFFEKKVNVSPSADVNPFELALFDGYTIHRSPINKSGSPISRKFLTITFASYLYDGGGSTINEYFRDIYPPPVHYCREHLSWLGSHEQHETAQRKMEKKRQAVERTHQNIDEAVRRGVTRWGRSKIMIVGEGRAGYFQTIIAYMAR
jgi:hypothetical protein